MDQNVFRLGLRVAIIIRNYSLKLLQHLKAGFSLLKNSTLHLLKSLEFMSKSFSGHGFLSAPSTAAVSVNLGRRAVPLAPAFQAAVVRSVEAAFFQPSTSCRCSSGLRRCWPRSAVASTGDGGKKRRSSDTKKGNPWNGPRSLNRKSLNPENPSRQAFAPSSLESCWAKFCYDTCCYWRAENFPASGCQHFLASIILI